MTEWFLKNFKIDQNRILNFTTNSWPCHAHFNGPSKVLMDIAIKNLLIDKLNPNEKL